MTFARQQAQRATELFNAGAISKQELEQAETALRTAEADLKALQAQVQQQQVQLRYFTVTAPTAGIVGDVPVRVGNQVTTQTLLTTIDQNDTLEVYVSVPVERAPRAQDRPADRRSSAATAQNRSRLDDDQLHLAARRRPDAVDAGEGHGAEPGRRAARVAVRPRADRVEDAPTAWSCRSPPCCASTASSSRSSPRTARTASWSRKQRAIKVGPIVGDNYPVLDGLKAGRSRRRLGRAEAGRRRADSSAPQPPVDRRAPAP